MAMRDLTLSKAILSVIAVSVFLPTLSLSARANNSENRPQDTKGNTTSKPAVAPSTDPASAVTKESKAGWIEELTDVEFPKTKASGKLHGEIFTMDRAEIQQGTLSLRQGTGFFADKEWKVFLFANDISRLEGHFLTIESEDTEPVKNMPHVYMSWKENSKDLPKTKTWTGNYIIKLKFGQVSNGKIPGQIYLCVPDMKRSFVAGTFEAVIK